MIPRARASRGFTLIELLVVIAIIAILAGLLFPIFAIVGNTAAKTDCTHKMSDIVRAMKIYRDDWKVYPDALFGWATDASGSGLQLRLYPEYIKDKKVFNCPRAPAKLNDNTFYNAINPMNGLPTAYFYPAWDSYDFQFRPNKDTSGARELHYNKKWSVGPAGPADYKGQLVYRDPPDETVVTWCLYHSDMNGAGNPGQNSQAVVAFLSGRVQTIPAAKMVNWTPAAGEPYPWQVPPKP